MKLKTDRIRLALVIFVIAGMAQAGLHSARAAGSISIVTPGSPYTEDFSTLANTGTSSTVPTGWALSESGSNADSTYAAGTGSSNSGNTYSFGTSASTERAFGGLQSGSLNPTIGASYTNSTGQTITELTISYTGEQWRVGTNRSTADRLDFQLSTDATGLTSGAWTDYDNLDFSSPIINTAAGALDGNDSANRTAISYTITGLNIPNGAEFWIRWLDYNASSSDDGLAIDDFSLTAVTTAGNTNPTGIGAADPVSVIAGNDVLLTVTVSPGANPASTGLAVAVDLTGIGGSATQTFYDDGTNGDVTPGDNIFSFLAAVPGATGAGAKSLPVTITDAENRTGNTTIELTVVHAAALVINEIDYDQPGSDAAEYVEIRNNDSVPVNLDAYSIQMINGNAGGAAQYQLFDLPDVELAVGDYFVLCGNAANVANCDLDVSPNTDLIQNGSPDAVALLLGSTIVDTVSYEGNTSGSYTEGSGSGLEDPGTTGSDYLSISRLPDGTDTNQNNVDFSTVCSTPGEANTSNTTDCEPDAAPSVVSTDPLNNATDFPTDGDLTVTFNEPVDVASDWYSLVCSVSGTVSAAVTGGPTEYTINPDTDLTDGESCTLTIYADKVTDQDADDPPDNMTANVVVTFSPATPVDVCSLSYTPVYDIQGSGLSAAITGSVTTQGVVVGDYEGASPELRGFYIQDAAGDGNAATSDGIFVFNYNYDDVNIGDVVRVSGTAGEYQDQTQISSVTSIANCGTGTVTPVDVTFPVSSATYLEQFEGMLVRFPQTMVVTEHYQLGRFGQVVMSPDTRLAQPTSIAAPGAPALAVQAANDLNKIIVDDELNNQNPDPILFGDNGNPLSASNTLRGGDSVTGMVGVMTYTWAGNSASGNAYRMRPVDAMSGGVPDFQPADPRPATAPALTGNVRVAGMNLLNYFNTFDGLPDNVDNCSYGVGGAPADCRGADDQAEFDRQWPKTVAAITGTNADVVGVIEIENDGYGSSSAIQELVDQLNTATSPGAYAFIDVDAATGQVNALGTDAIKVGLVYKPAAVTPVGTTAALNTNSFVTGGDSSPRNRPALAQAFELSNGEQFIVVVNHLKSKGSACDAPDAGDGQGNCNGVRTNAATELASWLATDPTGTGDSDILITGDLNSYAMEDPITALLNAGFTNLISSFNGSDAYSYVFDGQWGTLTMPWVQRR
ncbi:MAG: ExeM/NucH family extracellular endonuclease [Chloroflexota bacterium]